MPMLFPVSSLILVLVSRHELSAITQVPSLLAALLPAVLPVMAMDFNPLENCKADKCFLLQVALVMVFCHRNSKNELRQKLVQFRPGWRQT